MTDTNETLLAKYRLNTALSNSLAGRLQVIQELTQSREIFDEFGNLIEVLPPFITLTRAEMFDLLLFQVTS